MRLPRAPRPLARHLALLTMSAAPTMSSACFLFGAETTPTAAAESTGTAVSAEEIMARLHPTAPSSGATSTPPGGSSARPPSDQDKLGTPAGGGTRAGGEAGAAMQSRTGPAPFDAAVFVGKGSAGAPPDGFLPYPKTLKREDLSPLGRVEQDPDDADGPDPLVSVYPDRQMYERARLYYGSAATPSSVTIRFFESADPRAALRDLRAELERRYGKGKLRPDGATDDDFDRVLWRSPRMRLALDQSTIEIELMY